MATSSPSRPALEPGAPLFIPSSPMPHPMAHSALMTPTSAPLSPPMIVGGHIISGEGAGVKLLPISPVPQLPPQPVAIPIGTDGTDTAPAAIATQPTSGVQQQPPERKRVVRKVVKVPEKAERVLYCLQLKNPLRRVCINIVEWKYPFHLINNH